MKSTWRIFFLLPLLAFGTAAAWSEDPLDIVKVMEKKMYPNSKSEMTLNYVSSQGDKEEFRMVCYTKANNQKILVRFSAPASAISNDLIMLDRSVWQYNASSDREIRIPANQSFGDTGFSYGDVLRLNFSDNYTPKVTAEDEKTWTLDLVAKDRETTYYRVVLVVNKDHSPVSGTCYTRNGAVVKTLAYSNPRDLGSGIKPVTITVTSPLDPNAVNTLTITKERIKDYPDNIFNKRNLSAHFEDR